MEVELDTVMVQDFLSKVIVMRKFNHPNVMKLLGVTVHEDKPCIILPLMKMDLKQFLKQNKLVCFFRIQIFLQQINIIDDSYYIIFLQKCAENYIQSFSVGAAHGREYLADLNIVHRDLAARNCMQVLFCYSDAFNNQPPKTTVCSMCFRLNKNLVLKISDFGLSRDMQTKEYYKVENTSVELPVRWMSPESLTNWTFTTKSDVVRKEHISQVSQEHKDASLFHWQSDSGKHFWLPFDEAI